MAEETKKALDVFYCYAYEDKELLDELDKHLKPLQRRGEIICWSDREIKAGREWAKEIDEHLDMANIILLLVSPDFVASDYIYSKEMSRALARHAEGNARVIPILLRVGSYENEPFSQLQSLPSNQKPITQWHSRDEAWLNVVEGIKEAIREIRIDDYVPFQLEAFLPLDQDEILEQEIDNSELFQQKSTSYEVASPAIERLFSSLGPTQREKKKMSSPERNNPTKGKEVAGSDTHTGGLIVQAEPTQITFPEESTQLSLPFDEPDPPRQEKSLRKLRSGEYEARRVRAQRLFLSNQPRRALNLLKDLDFEPAPSSQRWRIAALRGHCYFGLGMFLPARADYTYAIEEMPDNIPEDQLQEVTLVHLSLATAQRELGDLDDATEQYHIALAQMDAGAQVRHFAEAYWGLALIKIEQASRSMEGQEHPSVKERRILQDARTYAEKAKTLYESTGEMLNSVSVACDIALIEQMAGNLDEARKHLQGILTTWSPMLTIPQNTVNNRKRLSQYRNVVSLACCHLAEVELAAHNDSEALAYAKRGHEIAQHSNTLRRAQASITLGEVLSAGNTQNDEAEMAFRRAIDILSSTQLLDAQVYAHKVLGRYFMKWGRVSEAKQEFDRAHEISLKAQGISKPSEK
jgi:tetratricopeptide (TPR) repeat protein